MDAINGSRDLSRVVADIFPDAQGCRWNLSEGIGADPKNLRAVPVAVAGPKPDGPTRPYRPCCSGLRAPSSGLPGTSSGPLATPPTTEPRDRARRVDTSPEGC